jgi:monoamine oxidase
MQTETLIIGGGLSGMSLAFALHRVGRDFRLVEARDRFGGRIHSLSIDGSVDASDRFDLGPAWFWPGQHRMAALADDLGLQVFEQYATGKMLVQQIDGSIVAPMNYSTMAGALRIEGGMMAIVDGIESRLPPERLLRESAVARIMETASGVITTGKTINSPFLIDAHRVVLALPPRLAHHTIIFDPPLLQSQTEAMRRIPTWMAGHAKVVAIYARPFWREKGLSGDAMSRIGPLSEIHDASPASGKFGALFGFFGLPASQRNIYRDDLASASIAQLTAIFGQEAAAPIDMLVQDWALEELTTTPEDLLGPMQHASCGTPFELCHLWEGKLVLASTEMATENGGLLEGALEITEEVVTAMRMGI